MDFLGTPSFKKSKLSIKDLQIVAQKQGQKEEKVENQKREGE